ncbi:MAG: amidophosphoribosyltransferase [Deltaproteobacteria bacterium]|nr:amidophosphoribosyltransferase [Deltaproteobacteria bacterium]
MCGIIGIWNHPQAANLAYLCLHAVQHRGQESCGMVTSDGRELFQQKGMGHVADYFSREILAQLPGTSAIGHTRYSTAGGSTLKNAQPFLINYAGGMLSVAHNGNLTNALTLRRQLEAKGSIFQSTMDSEVMMHLIAAQATTVPLADRIIQALGQVEGAYSVLFVGETQLIAARDPHGWRPLMLGRLGEAWILASETCAFDLVRATFVREIEPGEVVIFGPDGVTSRRLASAPRRAHCIFEYIYFARPDSHVYGHDVYQVRVGFGAELAREQPADVDVVCPIPDSGTPAAIGYARALGKPFELGLIRSHYVGRTFIEPDQSIRDFGVKLKLNPVRGVLAGRRVVLIDDSIMRGTTSAKIVRMVRAAGATEVHVRISSPPTRWPCFYGIDIPTREELIAAAQSVEQVRVAIGADSLGYLSEAGLYRWTAQTSAGEFCDACFTGRYPLDVRDAPAMMAAAAASVAQ